MRFLSIITLLFLSITSSISIGGEDNSASKTETIENTRLLDAKCSRIDLYYRTDPILSGKLGEELLVASSNTQIKHKAYGYFGLAQKEYKLEHFAKCILYLNKSLALFSQIPDSNKIGKINNQIGGINYIQGNDNDAFIYYMKAFKIATSLNQDTSRADLLNNLALVSSHQKDYKKADYYNLNAVEIYTKIGDQKSIADIYSNIAMSYSDRGQPQQGKVYIEKSLAIFNKLNDIKGKATALFFLGQIYEQNKNYPKSDNYFSQARTLYETLQDSVNIIATLQKIAHIAVREHDFKGALRCLETGLYINSKFGGIDSRLGILKELYEVYKELGDHKKSLENLERYQSLRDSVIQDSEARNLSHLRAEFDEDIKLKEIQTLKETSNQKTIILIIFTFLAGAIAFVLYGYWRHQQTKQKQKMLLLEQKVLRTQMDPHFLFNTMSAIQYFIMDDKPDEAIRFLGDFSALLRLVLQYSKDELISVAKEQKIIEYYLQLQNKRFTNRINFQLIIDPALLEEEILLPPMLAQPLIESFLEHNGFEKLQGGKITICYLLKGNIIQLTISDNGISDNGLNPKSETKHEYAMTTSRERISLINSLRSAKVTFTMANNIDQVGRGTMATFTIPIIQ